MALAKSTANHRPAQIKTLLLIEDNPDQQELIKMAFNRTFQKSKLVQVNCYQQTVAYLEKCRVEGGDFPS